MIKEMFDPEKHRFGMAYHVPREKSPVYIYDLSRSGASGYGIKVNAVFGRCKPVLCLNLEAAYRAPQFDMTHPLDKTKATAAAAQQALDNLLDSSETKQC